jgi:hypothetical protein
MANKHDCVTVFTALDPSELSHPDVNLKRYRTEQMISIHELVLKLNPEQVPFRVHALWNKDARTGIIGSLHDGSCGEQGKKYH